MKKALLVVALAVLALVAGMAALSSVRTRDDAAESRAERARLKREFDERAALARALPPEAAAEWRDEVNALGRAYFQGVAEVRNRYPRAPAPPTALQAAEAEKKGKLSTKDRELIEDFQKYADGRLALLTGGGYAALASAAGGGLRLDVVAVEPGASPGGGPGLRIDFALWGVPRLVERERSGERIVSRTTLAVSLKRLELRFFDAAAKRFGEMASPGEPYQKLADPERFAPDFPPGVLFGTWWMELLPREAAKIELALDTDVHGAAGASHPVPLALSLPVQEAWRIPPGATFQAETREAPPAGQ
jgi:hypothetical protein